MKKPSKNEMRLVWGGVLLLGVGFWVGIYLIIKALL